MNLAIILAQLIIPLLPQIEGDVASLVRWISSLRSATQQTGEWTEAMDEAFRNVLLHLGISDPAFQPDPPAGASTAAPASAPGPAAPAPSAASAPPPPAPAAAPAAPAPVQPIKPKKIAFSVVPSGFVAPEPSPLKPPTRP